MVHQWYVQVLYIPVRYDVLVLIYIPYEYILVLIWPFLYGTSIYSILHSAGTVRYTVVSYTLLSCQQEKDVHTPYRFSPRGGGGYYYGYDPPQDVFVPFLRGVT